MPMQRWQCGRCMPKVHEEMSWRQQLTQFIEPTGPSSPIMKNALLYFCLTRLLSCPSIIIINVMLVHKHKFQSY